MDAWELSEDMLDAIAAEAAKEDRAAADVAAEMDKLRDADRMRDYGEKSIELDRRNYAAQAIRRAMAAAQRIKDEHTELVE